MTEAIVEFFKKAIGEYIVNDPVWAIVFLVGQIIFGGRFVIQWIVSEYKKKSHVPRIFWYLSLVGSIILLIYSIHIHHPLFMLAFSLNSFIYIRNIHLILKHARRGEVTPIENDED